jgi:hypothetical protein
VNSIVSIIRTAQTNLFMVSDETRKASMERALALFKAPVEECWFHKNPLTYFEAEAVCDVEFLQLKRREAALLALLPLNWVGKSEVAVAKADATSCWVHCLGAVYGWFSFHRFVGAADTIRLHSFPIMIESLCDTNNCVLASRQATAAFVDRNVEQAQSVWKNAPEKIYWVLGITINVILISMCSAILILSMFVWKVFEFAKLYILILVFVVVSVVIEIVWWSLESARTFEAPNVAGSAILSVVTGLNYILAVCMLLILSFNWLTAFVFLMNGRGLSQFAERILMIVAFCVLVVLGCLGIGFGVAYSVYLTRALTLNALDFKGVLKITTQARFSSFGLRIVRLILSLSSVLLAMFLVISSAMGLVLLKRRGVSKDDLFGVIRFLVIVIFILVGSAIRAGNNVMTDIVQIYGPRWWKTGIVSLAAPSLIYLMFIAFCFFALLGVHGQRGGRISSGMSAELLEGSDDESSSKERVRSIPRAYDI